MSHVKSTDSEQVTGRPVPFHRSGWQGEQASKPPVNVGDTERAISVAAGAIAVLMGLSRRSVPGLVCAGVGGAMIYRGVTGHCHAYSALGVDTSKDESTDPSERLEDGIEVATAFLIDKPTEELYRYWRNFSNLPAIMTHLESVQVQDDRKSHWVAKAPAIAGGKIEWDAEITRDEPNSVIAWQSLAGSQVDTAGEIRFEKGMGDRGTEVHVHMKYRPPAGKVGHWVAKIFGEAPTHTIREDLRNFKRIMEIGEVPTIQGQPRGTCADRGKREGA